MLPANNPWYILVFSAIFGSNFVDFGPPSGPQLPTLYSKQFQTDDSESSRDYDDQCSRDPDYIIVNDTQTSALQQYSGQQSTDEDYNKAFKQNILMFATTFFFIISLLQICKSKWASSLVKALIF